MEILGVIGLFEMILIFGFALIVLVVWIIALVDILSNEFEGRTN